MAHAIPDADSLLLPPWRQISTEPFSIPDPVLGAKPNPRFPGHDARGYRNAHVFADADIVVFGDSQTYGLGVRAEDAWPVQLQKLVGARVYNMAFAGYGPTHGLALWDDAVKSSPKIVLQALYSGNDLYDSFAMVYRRGQLTQLRDHSGELEEAISRADAVETLEHRIARTFPGNPRFGSTSRSSVGQESPRRSAVSTFEWVKNHSRVYGMIARARWRFGSWWDGIGANEDKVWKEQRALASTHSDVLNAYDIGTVRTILTPGYRLSGLDQRDRRIQEGARVSMRTLEILNARAAKNGIRFCVVLIPTKELVFRRLVDKPMTSYRVLVEQEESFWRSTQEFLKQHGVESIDVLPALEAEVASGRLVYPITWDGHPNQAGHQVIAKVVAEWLRPEQ